MLKNSKRLLALVIPLALSACATMQMGQGGTAASGTAAGASSSGANSQLVHCPAPLGTLAIAEHQQDSWYQLLTTTYGLPDPAPVLDLIAQQSNCFMIVNRGQGFNESMEERHLAQSGALRRGSNFHRHQMVAADYTMVPSVTFSNNNAGGVAAGVLGAFVPYVGLLAGGMNVKEASTILTLDDNRSGIQVAAASGSARNFDFGGFGALFGGAIGGLGGYQNTAQGKVVVAAFVDSYNNMVKSLQNYQAQHIAGGPGKGGALKVQGGG
ncbi:peptidoglycan-binding protein [Metallibacterium scheffleri]|uniref:Peptidoglycan-binding protein n=2 Tax=Metallibacterium scheffleri TaxID=993689 RepID=A0A4S3KQS7_9GAMM|nr:peptidoglycan-binding protein [Metallibacterium scheffleri]